MYLECMLDNRLSRKSNALSYDAEGRLLTHLCPVFRFGVLLVPGLFLTGCETFNVLQQPEARGTGGGGTVRVAALSTQAGKDERLPNIRLPPEGTRERVAEPPPLGPTSDRRKEPKAVQDVCYPLQERDRRPRPELGLLGPTTIPLIMAGVELIYSSLSNALKDSATEKIKRFQAPYSGQVNVASFVVGNEDGRVRCLELVRTIGDGSAGPTSRIVLGLVPIGKTAVEIIPVYVRLNQLAASTLPKEGGGQVALAITVGVETLASDGGDLGVRHYQRNLTLQNIRAGQDYERPRANASAIMPLPSGQPATIVVSVTETGDGFQSIKDFEAAFDSNSRIIGSAIGKAVETRLTAISEKD